MKPTKYKREGADVMRNGKVYANAVDNVAAATIVDALIRAEGRIPKGEE